MMRDQARASMAFEHVQSVEKADEKTSKLYATVVYESIPLVHSAGLVQALEMLRSYSNSGKREQGQQLLTHLGRQMNRVTEKIKDGETLCAYAREEADLHKYMMLSREIMAVLVWYRRFVQSMLKMDPDTAQTEGE